MTDALDKDLDDILEAAAAWHTRLDLGTADQKAFERWRNADPRHAAAFARMVGTGATFGLAEGHIDTEADDFEVPVRVVDRRRWLAGALVGVAAVIIGGGSFVALANRRVHAETTVGGRANVALPDGGHIDLNTDSRIAWRYDNASREIWLERGEVSLNLPAGDRPWRLHAQGRVIMGLAGKLNARLRGQAVEVTVIEGPGIVILAEHIGGRGKLALAAGQSALAGKDGGTVRALSDETMQTVTAWQSDEMVFTGQPLSMVVDEFNRYLSRKIVIKDPSIAGVRLGGRFNVHNASGFLRGLNESFGIRATDDGQVINLTR